MSRTALIKLLFVGILTFIICLPEFFTIYRVSKVNFFCLPYPPCEQGNTVKKGENRKTDDSAVTRKDMCDFPQQNQSNMTNSAPDGDSSTMSLFMCEANTNMAELDNNTSFTDLTFSLEVSVEVQLTDAETLNLTLYGRSNHSSLHLHSPEEEEEEEEEKEKEKGEGQRKAFYCCLPRMPASEPANQSRCLLWLANLTVLTAAAKEELPWKRTQKDEWQCGMRILWLALVCSVLLMIVTIVITEICRGKYLCRKPKVCPVSYNFTGHHLNGVNKTGSVKKRRSWHQDNKGPQRRQPSERTEDFNPQLSFSPDSMLLLPPSQDKEEQKLNVSVCSQAKRTISCTRAVDQLSQNNKYPFICSTYWKSSRQS